MASNSVPVVAIIKAKPGQEQVLEDVLKGLVGPTHREAGCVRYVLHRSSEDPSTFVFVEKWDSPESLKKHLGSSHIGAAFARQQELIADIRVMSLAAIGGGDSDKGSY